jgi:PE family/PPE-SVP subfamily C-terminal region
LKRLEVPVSLEYQPGVDRTASFVFRPHRGVTSAPKIAARIKPRRRSIPANFGKSIKEPDHRCRNQKVGPFVRRNAMSFVTTQPEAMMAAASALQTLGTSMDAENEAAAAPITGVAPAAADEVSALQAAEFGAYGTWYQQVSTHAAAIHQMLVNTLGTSAGSYAETESANQSATGSTSSTSLSSLLGGLSGAAVNPAQVSSSTGATIATPFNWAQNFGAAGSQFIALGQGQFLPEAVNWNPADPAAVGMTDGAGRELPAAALTGSAGGGAPGLAGVGRASSLDGISVPPSWAAGTVPVTNPAATTQAGAGWTSPAPQTSPVATMPAGVPSVASTGRAGYGFGAPRYGVKPTVMPKPTGFKC